MAITNLKSAYKKFIFNLSANNSSLNKFFYKNFYTPKKGSLAELLNAYSKSRAEVVFVQVGANDGFFHDPLYKFIIRDGWRGVMLEPQAYVFNTFLKKLHRNTPNAKPLNVALDLQDGEKSIYKIAFSQSRWATGLTSFRKEVIEEAIESGHVARCAKRYGEVLPARKEDYIAEEKIQCISVPTLLQNYNLQPLNWLQIDAEGYDFEIIKMFNIGETKPTVIAFEHSHLSAEDKASCHEHLLQNGYAITAIGENTVAMLKPLGSFERFFS